MANFKLVATDLDGTLLKLKNGNEISPITVEVIKKVKEKGVKFTFCTGRMFSSALPYAQELGIDVPLVTYEGALVRHPLKAETIYQRFLPLAEAKKIVEWAHEEGLALNAYYNDQLYIEELRPETKDYIERSKVKAEIVGNFVDFLDKDPIKLVALSFNEEQLKDFEEKVRRNLGDKVYVTRSLRSYLEFTHPEATKAHGLRALVDYLSLEPDEVMVIGDSYNDLAMFEVAGFAVAVGNAAAEVKAKADFVTENNEDEGVAEALLKFILENHNA
jgi:hypothetical protein